ncbi:hypothetical protein GQ44DRAFT_828377 [Phaeosphaeriaceae sp. PMI808]|nr:hypothetical protein GQ44DRAFT_828377 [Phaeosphaeriaceae sp. PMI808]
MARNKPRLQLALYARPKHPDTYHYTLLLAPKCAFTPADSAIKYHLTDRLQTSQDGVAQSWSYERLNILDIHREHGLLARVVIAKVTLPDAIEKILEALPIIQVDDQNESKSQLCVCLAWVQSALKELEKEGAITGSEGWERIQKKSLDYVEKKRRVGRWHEDWQGGFGVPMLDLLIDREIVE